VRNLDVTDSQLLHMFELCLDAETRCIQRYQQAKLEGDYDTAAYEAQLRDKYRLLKHRLFEGMAVEGRPNVLDDVVKQIQDLGRRWQLRKRLA
jgi:hypothetical protein